MRPDEKKKPVPPVRPVPRREDYDRVNADDETPDVEPTYRDGSLKNECWRDD